MKNLQQLPQFFIHGGIRKVFKSHLSFNKNFMGEYLNWPYPVSQEDPEYVESKNESEELTKLLDEPYTEDPSKEILMLMYKYINKIINTKKLNLKHLKA